MSANYEEIRKDNIRRRGEEFDDIGKLISEQLYSDRTHFIYELLQNAEDALGRRKQNNPESRLENSVQFILYEDRLEFRHFGEKFDINDVKGISDVLKGTKSKDRSQIGKFGIGFKSVYAFTSTPEIHSGKENFIIERYIRPKDVKKHSEMTEEETVFIFPFNHEELGSKQAFDLISDKLVKIGSRALLFLKNISEIEWEIKGQDKGRYLKEAEETTDLFKKVYVIGEHGGVVEEEGWLVFKRYLDGEKSSCASYVEIAFKIKPNKKTKKAIIQKITASPLVVYFPTKLETNLGFLIQGPYDTTASRSTIDENEWNQTLIKETSHLLTKYALPALKEMGLLTIELLESLPIRPDDFPKGSKFRCIYDDVRSVLKTQELLPTADGQYVSGMNAKVATGKDLVDLISPAQLTDLYKHPQKLHWLVTDITDAKPDIFRYLTGWKPKLWEPGETIESLSNNRMEVRAESIVQKLTKEFLKKQDDEWIIHFYLFSAKRKALWNDLKGVEFVRLQDDKQVFPFKEDGTSFAYLPPEDKTDFFIVKRKIANDPDVLSFLKDFGIQELDVVAEVFEKTLLKYEQNTHSILLPDHLSDMKKIWRAYATDSSTKKQQLKTRLGNTKFIYANNLTSQRKKYVKPNEVYFGKEDLKIYFEGNKDILFVVSEYSSEIFKMIKDLGGTETVRVERKLGDTKGYVKIRNSHGSHERGVNGFDPSIEVDGIKHALANPSFEKSLYIWNTFALPYRNCIQGIIETSGRKDFSGETDKKKIISNFGKILINTAWLPSAQGIFYKPNEIELDDLPEVFHRDEKLAEQLGMKKDVVAKLAEKVGVQREDIDFIKQNPEEFSQWKKATSRKQAKPAFPLKKSVNPERREERLLEDLAESPEKTYENKERSVRTSKGTIDSDTFLRNLYTNNENQMVCQICEIEMPFKKRNGEYYVESVEVLDKNSLVKEHEAQYLALCPLCSAKYKEFVKKDKGALDKLKSVLLKSDGIEIPIILDERATIRFVEIHIKALKIILQEKLH